MAQYISKVSPRGGEVLTQLLALGRPLTVTRAEASDQIDGPALPVEVLVGEKVYVPGSPPVTRIPVEVTNNGLTGRVYIRQIRVCALDSTDQEFVFAHSDLEGPDGDNVLDPPMAEGTVDTSHIHDVNLLITPEESGIIQVEVSPGFGVTYAQMTAYAAPLHHTQAAQTIIESTGEHTEEAQRRQDYAITALQEQLNTGFTGTTVICNFTADLMGDWTGWDGTGQPVGALDPITRRVTGGGE